MKLGLEAEKAANKANRIAAANRQAYDWDPVQREHHCSNCRNCVVFEQNDEPMARCDKALGRMDGAPKPLCFLTKPTHPYSWIAAAKCPEFQCMSDGCQGHTKEAPTDDTTAD